MSWTIKWTKKAREDYAETLTFVEQSYGRNSALRLLEKVEKAILRIQRFPQIYPFSEKLNAHKAVVSKQVSIIYLVGDTEIFISRIKDNRMG
ncbi:MAG: type II toxin-antitoxin system RelE/ParE family toxin [Saprospiraceae bacterium]